MRKTCRAMVAGLAIALLLSGCAPRMRDVDMGANRYLVTVNGNGYTNLGAVEQLFQARAHEVAREHGFDSYSVSQFSSGYAMTALGPKPTARGVVYVYNGPKATADGKAALPAGSMSSGTAFAISQDGVLVTNAHVAASCAEITVRQFDGTTLPASLLAADGTNDLALIKIASATPDFAQLRGAPEIRQGESVIAVGFPLHDLLSEGTNLTTGTVSALAGIKNDSRRFQVSTPVQHGNSGGPLLDQSGNVVGIVSSGIAKPIDGSMPQNVNFAIKTAVVRTFLDSNRVTYKVVSSEKQLPTPEIGERARKFTSFVVCKT